MSFLRSGDHSHPSLKDERDEHCPSSLAASPHVCEESGARTRMPQSRGGRESEIVCC